MNIAISVGDGDIEANSIYLLQFFLREWAAGECEPVRTVFNAWASTGCGYTEYNPIDHKYFPCEPNLPLILNLIALNTTLYYGI